MFTWFGQSLVSNTQVERLDASSNSLFEPADDSLKKPLCGILMKAPFFDQKNYEKVRYRSALLLRCSVIMEIHFLCTMYLALPNKKEGYLVLFDQLLDDYIT